MERPAIPDTPAGEHLRWWLDAIDDVSSVTAADVISRYVRMWPQSAWLQGDEDGRAAWRKDWEEFGAFTIESVEPLAPHEIAIVLAPVNSHRRKITFLLEQTPPHRLRAERWERVFDFDLVIREATPDDAVTLADVERRAAVQLGDTKTITDRGDDYFAAARLMEDVTVFLAEVEGQPAGVAWGVFAPIRFRGEDKNCSYFIHLRVTPEHQRKGLWGAFDNAVWWKYWERSEFYVGYYMIENTAWSHVAKQVQARPDFVARDWVPTVYRVLLPTAALAGAAAGVRPATRSDAAQIVDILNTFHDGEEFYRPYTEESLVARLERDAGYSWDQVLLADGAVLGVWPAGDTIRIITESPDETTTTRRGHVMDYGFLPGAEATFSSLLAASSTKLDARGIPQLSIFTSRGARAQPLLKQLKGTVESYRFNTGTAAQIPDEAQNTGIYTDHIFF